MLQAGSSSDDDAFNGCVLLAECYNEAYAKAKECEVILNDAIADEQGKRCKNCLYTHENR